MTAEEILDKHSTDTTTKGRVRFAEALAAMREISEQSFEFGKQRGIAEEVEDTCGFIQDAPDKEAFMKQLFPEKL